MRLIKTYNKFLESLVIDLKLTSAVEVMESLNIWQDALLSSIGAEEMNMYNELKLPQDDFQNKDLDFFHGSIEFINSLSSLGLKRAQVQNTDDYATFVNKPVKFMFIYKIESNELENPEYILIQSWNETIKQWEDVRFYKVTGDAKKFYDKLASKTIEIIDGDENYIYTSSNANEWVLQNSEKENDTYKKVFRKEELESLLDERKVKVSIV